MSRLGRGGLLEAVADHPLQGDQLGADLAEAGRYLVVAAGVGLATPDGHAPEGEVIDPDLWGA